MKKIAIFLLMMALFLSSACAAVISPTTGLPLDGEPTAPMIAVISHTEGSVKINGRTITAAGVGKRQPWGGQQADIVYESLLYQDGCSRFAYLYHDALVRGEAISAGPIRSVRDVHIGLSKAWNAGLVYSAGTDSTTPALVDVWHRAFSRSDEAAWPYMETIKGKKAPDCFSADVAGLHGLLKEKVFIGRGFAFTDSAPDHSLPSGVSLRIQWGNVSNRKQVWSTQLTYDADKGKYMCFSGRAPFKTFHDALSADESQFAFDNVIVQYASHSFPTRMLSVVDLLSGGRAVILRGGKRMDARWISENGQTRFVDDAGNEVPLSRGKTYIAFWDEGLGELLWE